MNQREEAKPTGDEAPTRDDEEVEIVDEADASRPSVMFPLRGEGYTRTVDARGMESKQITPGFHVVLRYDEDGQLIWSCVSARLAPDVYGLFTTSRHQIEAIEVTHGHIVILYQDRKKDAATLSKGKTLRLPPGTSYEVLVRDDATWFTEYMKDTRPADRPTG